MIDFTKRRRRVGTRRIMRKTLKIKNLMAMVEAAGVEPAPENLPSKNLRSATPLSSNTTFNFPRINLPIAFQVSRTRAIS